MRTLTKINWVRVKKTDHMGYLRLTIHTGTRGNWTFRIETPAGGSPELRATHPDGRQVSSDHDTLAQAKDAALDVMHPSEVMGWVSTAGPVRYRANWDDLSFAVYMSEGALYFQYRDTSAGSKEAPNGYLSTPEVVSGIREAREMARAVLRERYPFQSPTSARRVAGDAEEAVLRAALASAGIVFTAEQLSAAATALAAGTA